MTAESDTTGSTPDIFSSPDRDIVVGVAEVAQTITSDVVGNHVIIQARRPQARNPFDHRNFKGQPYQGVMHVEETEQQDKSSDSEDDIPVATLLRQEKGSTLTLQQIQDCKEGSQGERATGQDCKEGSQGERAIGVSVAKNFGG